MRCEEIEVDLSGYLDGELTQQHRQLVQIHVEDCSRCREVFRQLQEVKTSTQSLKLDRPNEEELCKMQTHVIERIGRRLGWLMVVVWSAVTALYAFYQYAKAPNEPLFEKILVFGLFLGLALLFFSVLSERLRESRSDRYKGVEK